MLGLEGYGSDDSDAEPTPQSTQLKSPAFSSKKSSFSLPPPSNVTKAPSLQTSKVKSKRPVFHVSRPSKASSDDEEEGHERAAKKPRLESGKGAGSSSLLAILPAPSKATTVPVIPQRVLGSAAQSGGATGVIMPSAMDGPSGGEVFTDFSAKNKEETEVKSTTLVPLSVGKGKSKPPPPTTGPATTAVDFFSLGTTTSRTSTPTGDPTVKPSASISIMSAPTIPVFEPPTPTPSDPYPGYYQLPSGQWAAYDPDFYKKHYDSWYTSQSLDGTSQKGFEGAEGDNTVEIDAQEQLDLARKEREEKKSLTTNAGGGPTAPNMNIKAPKMGSRARTRHQLSALLTEAYENREALEERIAQGRRNRKEAGNKYGF